MPLSKKRNAELMRKLRYNRRLSPSTGSNSVVPKPPKDTRGRVLGGPLPTDKGILIARDYLDNADVPDDLGLPPDVSYIDADGNIVYE